MFRVFVAGCALFLCTMDAAARDLQTNAAQYTDLFQGRGSTRADFRAALREYAEREQVGFSEATENQLVERAFGYGAQYGDSNVMAFARTVDGGGGVFAQAHLLRVLTDSPQADLYLNNSFTTRVPTDRYSVFGDTITVRMELRNHQDCTLSVDLKSSDKAECYFTN